MLERDAKNSFLSACSAAPAALTTTEALRLRGGWQKMRGKNNKNCIIPPPSSDDLDPDDVPQCFRNDDGEKLLRCWLDFASTPRIGLPCFVFFSGWLTVRKHKDGHDCYRMGCELDFVLIGRGFLMTTGIWGKLGPFAFVNHCTVVQMFQVLQIVLEITLSLDFYITRCSKERSN